MFGRKERKKLPSKAKGNRHKRHKSNKNQKRKDETQDTSRIGKSVSWLLQPQQKDNNNNRKNKSIINNNYSMPKNGSEEVLREEMEELKAEFKKVKKELKKFRKSAGSSHGRDGLDGSHSHSTYWEGDGIKVDDKKDAAADEVVTESKLPPDTFSFFLISRTCSIPFFCPIAVFVFQIAIFLLVILDIVVNDDKVNPLQLPVMVSPFLRIAQFFAIIVAVITQDDIRTGITHLREGYDGKSLAKAFNVHRNVGKALRGPSFHVAGWKWYTASVARFFEGSLGLIVTFYLIVQSGAVLDLLLNFTAMSFVSQLDEVVYYLANEGFMGKLNRITANAIEDTEYFRRIVKGKGININRGILYSLILIIMLVLWGLTIWYQGSGMLLCRTVYVQFGDDFLPHLGSFSGLYDMRASPSAYWSRTDYLERRSKELGEEGRGGRFAYCEDLTRWTFSFPDEAGARDPCNNWSAMSSETETYNFPDTAQLTWYVRNADNRMITMQFFRLRCYDCERIPAGQQCSGHGTSCNDAVCECEEGWYGLRCEFREPCASLQMDVRFDSFPIVSGNTNSEWSDSYDIFRAVGGEDNPIVESYHRPVYISEYQLGVYDIIFYTGRRWALTRSTRLNELRRGAREDIATYFQDEFHSYWSNYSIAFITAPMDFGTPEDATSPAGIRWLPPASDRTISTTSSAMATKLEPDNYREILTILLCSQCDDEVNPCEHGGTCFNGACQCENGARGTLCEIIPLGNGRCDTYFNTIEFQYDGGDCCESTCVSSPEYTCGRDESGYTNLGFPHCYMSNVEPDWNVAGDPVNGLGSLAQSGHSVSLSGNGHIMVVGEPGSDSVNLLDRDGSQWNRRWTMQGPVGSQFGALTASSVGGSMEMVNNPSTRVPIVVAAAAPNNPDSVPSISQSGFVRVYNCSFGCEQIGSDLDGFFSFDPSVGDDYSIAAIDLSSDGRILVVAALTTVSASASDTAATATANTAGGGRLRRRLQEGNLRSTVVVYEQDLSSDTGWIVRSHTFVDNREIYGLSLSGSGDTFAVLRIQMDPEENTVYQSSVQAFRWDGNDNNDYVPEGSPLNFRSRTDAVHNSVSLSDSGNMLAIGSGNTVQIYDWMAARSEWVQLGSNITLVTPQSSVSLSNDGSVVAIDRSVPPNMDGAGVNFGNGVFVEAFIWDGNDWAPLGEVVSPEADRESITSRYSALSLSANGHVLAIGLPWAGIDAAGSTYVYEFPPVQCRQGDSLLRLSITTDDRPQDIEWSIRRRDPVELLLRGGPYNGYVGSTFVDEICVADDDCVMLAMTDSSPGGSTAYTIFLGGQEYERGTITTANVNVNIGSC